MSNGILRKMISALLVVFVFISSVFFGLKNAEASSNGIVNVSVLNVRAEASTDSKILGKLKNKDIIDIKKTTGKWTEIVFNSRKAFVFSQYITLTNGLSNQKTEKLLTPTVSKLNTREGEGTNFKITGTVAYGEKIKVIIGGSKWGHFYVNGKKHFVFLPYMKESQSSNQNENSSFELFKGKVTATKLNVRSSSSTYSQIIGQLKQDDLIVYGQKNGEWGEITYNNKTGYVYLPYIQKLVEKKEVKPTVKALNIRVFPSTTASILGTLSDKDTVEVENIYPNWGKIKWNNKIGYISLDYVKDYKVLSLKPQGFLDNPAPGTTVRGNYKVSGWFLDSNGVSKIEVLVDGNVVGVASYGISRPDVKKVFPEYNNSYSGYTYTLDTTKLSDGNHTITVRETGKNGVTTTLTGHTFTVKNAKLESRGEIDDPPVGASVKGNYTVRGWFLDSDGVSKIEVLVDGILKGTASYGKSRPDVKRVFPEYNNSYSGYTYTLDTTKLSDGSHTITIKVTSKTGKVTTLPGKIFTVANTTSQQSYKYIVVADALNVRNQPDLNGAVVGKVFYGQELQYVQSLSNGWTKIKFKNQDAYVNSLYIKSVPSSGTGNGQSGTYANIKGKIIILDAGHGGRDSGAVGNGLYEKEITLNLVNRVKEKLEKNGATVILTRKDDTFLALSSRTTISNNSNAQIFVSIHANSAAASSATGVETYYYNGSLANQSSSLATNILEELLKASSIPNRGVKTANFHVIKYNKKPSTLIELGFVSNSSDAAIMKDGNYRDKAAEAIVKGISKYFN